MGIGDVAPRVPEGAEGDTRGPNWQTPFLTQSNPGGAVVRIVSFLALTSVAAPAWSAANAMAFVYPSIPTLDEIGLGALIALVAGVAGWAVRKRHRR